MAYNVFALPSCLVALQGSRTSHTAAGLQVSAPGWAPGQSRHWEQGRAVKYHLATPSLSLDDLDTVDRFFRRLGSDFCSYVEPESRTHVGLYCGRGDGTKTTFRIPLQGHSGLSVFVDGVKQDSGYLAHTTANILDQDAAEATDFAEFAASRASLQLTTGWALENTSSIKVIPDGITANGPNVHAGGTNWPVVAGQYYTTVISVFNGSDDVHAFKPRQVWLVAGVYHSLGFGSTWESCTRGWSTFSYGEVCPATVDGCWPQVGREVHSSVDTDPFWADCFSLTHGDYDVWHSPDTSPGLIEFATAPARGALIECSATGYRWSRCRVTSEPTWTTGQDGRSRLQTITVEESLEY